MSESSPTLTGTSTPSVSVIIPMYNSVEFIEKCVRSLMEQTLEDLELIFIDDASTDGTLNALENTLEFYPETKKLIKIIKHPQNKGVSLSRKEGMHKATGEWVIHCDSDDYVEPYMYERMLRVAYEEKSDMVICSFNLFGNGLKSLKKIQGDGEISSEELLGGIFGTQEREFHGSLCNKLIKKAYLTDIKLPSDLSYCEDSLTLHQISQKFKKIIVIPDILYHYRQRNGSLVRRDSDIMERQARSLIAYLNDNKANLSQKRQNELRSLIISVLHRVAQGSKDKKAFSNKYKIYLSSLNINKRLNYFERLFLKQSLKGNIFKANLVGYCNHVGKKYIKKLLNLYRNI